MKKSKALRRVLVLLLTAAIITNSSAITSFAAEIGNPIIEDELVENMNIPDDTVQEDYVYEEDGELVEKDSYDVVTPDQDEQYDLNLFDGMNVEGTDSLGAALADKLSDKASEQIENKGCNIFSITMNGKNALVEMDTIEDAKIVVGIYDEKTDKLLASGENTAKAGEHSVNVKIEGTMPQYYMVRAFMTGVDDLAPLCKSFETPDYTEDMQKFYAMTTDDFDEALVFNYDDDKTKNYLVFNESVTRIKDGGEKNRLVSENEVSRIYEFENVDEKISGLKHGDQLSYEFSDNRLLIISVDTIEINGANARITGQDRDVEDAFDYIRIDLDSSDYDNCASVDDSDLEEGITYVGRISNDEINNDCVNADIETTDEFTNDAIAPEPEQSIKDTFKFVGYKTPEINGASAEINGNVNLGLGIKIKYTLTTVHCSLEVKFDYSLAVQLEISGKAEAKIHLAKLEYLLLAIFKIEIKPEFVIELSAKVTFEGSISGVIGFSVDDGEFNNLTTRPELRFSIKGEVTVFVGVELTPKISDITGCFAELSFSGKVGVEATGKTVFYEKSTKIKSSSEHLCKNCVDGDFYFKTELKAKAKFAKWQIERTITPLKHKIGDWYFSFDLDKFGMGECPNRGGATTFRILNGSNKPIKNADILIVNTIDAKDRNSLKSNNNGMSEALLPKGNYSVTISANGYKSKKADFEIANKTNMIFIYNLDKGSGDEDDDELVTQNLCLGEAHSAAIDTNGNLWMWGANDEGQLGDGTTEDRNVPIKIMENIRFVSLGDDYSAAIDTSGNLWMWGANHASQLGDGTTEDRNVPIKIMENIKSVSLGDDHSAAIDTSGDLWMWGSNGKGQLGDGTTEDRNVPVKIVGNVKSVSLGGDHSAVIDTSGNLWMWGWNYYGQIDKGNRGSQKYVTTPVKVMENVRSVSLGDDHSAAIDTSGNLWMWGSNSAGKLGEKELDCHQPVKVMGNAKAVSLGGDHSAAIDTSGGLWIWGYNSEGQLGYGYGTTALDHKPVKIMENAKTVSLGRWHSGAIDTNENLWMWGLNSNGELGDGTASNSGVPIKIELKTSDVSNGYTDAADFDADLSMSAGCFDESDANDVSIDPDRLSGDGSFSINGSKLDFYGLDANSIYNVYSLREGDTTTPLSAANLLYIAQKASDSNGTLSIDYNPKEVVDSPAIIAVKQRDPIQYISADAISISESEVKMKKEETIALSAEVTPDDATEKSISWESTDTNIATVDNAGKVTAVGDGTAFICATSKDGGYKVYCSIYVGEANLESDDDKLLTIVAGQKINLKQNCFLDVGGISRYVVSSKKKASVSKGMLSGLKPGTVTVTAQKKISKKKYEDLATCTVTILNKPKLKFKVPMTYVGQTRNATDFFTTSDTNTIGATYWESSNPSVVEVTDPVKGKLVARKAGSAKITAYFGEKGKKGTLKVSAKLSVKKPAFKKTTYSIRTGGKATLAMKNVTTALNPVWEVVDETIATAAPQVKKGKPTGKVSVIGLSAGETTLKAIIDGQEYSCTIKVKEPKISKTKLSVKVNKTATISLKNTKLPKSSIEWYSEDESIATVSKSGKIKGISKGETVIWTEAGGVRNECVVTVK